MKIYKEGRAPRSPSNHQFPSRVYVTVLLRVCIIPTIVKMNTRRRRHCGVVLIAVVVVVVVVAIAPAPSQALPQVDDMFLSAIEKRDQRQTFCGSHLSQALEMVCQGRYYSPFSINKKNIGIPIDELRRQGNDPDDWKRRSQYYTYDILQGLQSELGNAAWMTRPSELPFRERLNARAFLSIPLRRHIRGVVDECCAKPCSLKQLQAYCEN